jgi:hypothetical protein
MEITAEIITSFRTAYPQFADLVKWPDSVVSTALCEGDAESGGKCWGAYDDICSNFKQRGMFLYAAHWLTATYPAGASDTSNVNSAGAQSMTGKTVGDESVSFAAFAPQTLAEAGNTWLLATSYGQQFLRLRKRAGMGGRAV